MVEVTVTTSAREYPVVVGAGVLTRADDHLPAFTGAEKAFVVADQAVAELALAPLTAALARRGLQVIHLGVPAGEDAKSLAQFGTLARLLATQEAHRDDPVVALGGGSVGDLAGFVAATYMRGVPFVQVPTTLTAQVDAAIGGKTGVNLPEGKNLVGAFHQPVAVLADVALLGTLPDVDYRAGLAEVAKVALALDGRLLATLEERLTDILERDPATLEGIVERCVRAKGEIVASDERDGGARLFLNYGHTLGHALERLDGFGNRTHGEAVAVGMRFAAQLAEDLRIAEPGLVGRHARLLASLGLEPLGPFPEAEEILAAFRMDKKYSGGVRFVLLEALGRPRIVEGVTEDQIRAALSSAGVAA